MKQTFKLTADGVKELTAELEHLTKQRMVVADRLKAAKEQGDLSENSEWDNAKEEQAQVEGRIKEVDYILANKEIITNGKKDKVSIGNTVEIKNGGSAVQYTIVGSLESNPAERKISDESPIGMALLDKKVGDEVELQTPAGLTTYKILKIS